MTASPPQPAETTLLAHGLVQDPGAVPLVIGVVGHRDPVECVLPLLHRNLERQLRQLLRELPHTPLLMLNGLAEGMDSLAAEVFLEVVAADRMERGDKAPPHQLIAALPKTPESFRDDFPDPGPLKVLEDLLRRCDGILHPGNCEELRLPPDLDGRPRAADDPACYGRQGIFMVRNCFLLLAFFDGIDTRLVGGTAQSVAMQKGEIHPLFVGVEEVMNRDENGVLIQHHTPRRKPGSPAEQAGRISYWPAAAKLEGARAAVEGGPDALAAAVASTAHVASPDHAAADVQIPAHLLRVPLLIEGFNAVITDPAFQPRHEPQGLLTRLHTLADRRATDSKRRYRHWCRVLVITGFVLVLLAQLMSWGQGLWWGLLLMAFVLFPRLQQPPKRDFIAQRSLAECLTVQDLWVTTGIGASAADLFMARGESDLGWIRTVVRSVRLQLLGFHSHEPLPEAGAHRQARAWIEGQVAYLQGASRRERNKAMRSRIAAGVPATIAVVLAMLQGQAWMPEGTAAWVVVLLAAFASVIAHSELMGYEDTADRYELSLAQFRRALQALQVLGADPPEQTRRPFERERIVLEAIGREKLDELNQWATDQLQRVYAPGT